MLNITKSLVNARRPYTVWSGNAPVYHAETVGIAGVVVARLHDGLWSVCPVCSRAHSGVECPYCEED